MAWIIGSVDPHIVLNLRPRCGPISRRFIARIILLGGSSWNMKLPYFNRIVSRFPQFMNRLVEYIDIVYEDLSNEDQIVVQQVHETTKRDQFLMKLRNDFEGIQSNLMNKAIVPSLDTCLNELLRKKQHLLYKVSIEQQKYGSFLVAYAAQGKPKRRDLSVVQCFCCKELGHFASHYPKKFCNYCKKDDYIIKECPIRSPRKTETTFSVVADPSTGGGFTYQNASVFAQPMTPEIVQQMIIFPFFCFRTFR